MILCGVVIFASAVMGMYFRKKEKRSQAKLCMMLLLSACLGVAAEAAEEQDNIWVTENQLRRGENGTGDYMVELELEVPDVLKEEHYEIMVKEQRLSAAEERAYLEAAKMEIEQTFLGENESYENVQSMVNLQETYQEGKVTAEWSFDNYRIIRETGEIVAEDISQNGEQVCATVCLTCEDSEEEFVFGFLVKPAELSEEQRLLRLLSEELTKENMSEEEQILKIPQKLEKYTLNWRIQKSYTAIKILMLGVFVVICYPRVEESRRQEARKKREKQLLMQYPDMVSKLTLLLGAGMTLAGAWKKIATNYEKKRKNNTVSEQPVYEEMIVTYREMESGMGEAKAFERFGERCGLRQYRRFSSILSQNLKKGARGLNALLEAEAENAFEERKSEARKYGEEAGTKLLLPMMLMFGIVVFIIMVPAMISFQM